MSVRSGAASTRETQVRRAQASRESLRRRMNGWMSLVALVLVANGPTGDTASALAVRVEAPDQTDDRAVLDVDAVLAALRLRLEPAGVDVLASRFQRPHAWQLELTFPTPTQLRILVTSPRGEVWCDSSLDTSGRRPKDLAHTIALLVVETLVPHLEAPAAPPEEKAPPPAPPIARSPWSWGLGVAASGAWFLPDPALRWGLQVVAQLSYKALLFDFEVAAWLPRTRTGADFVVGVQPGLVRLGVGAQKVLGWAHLSGALGPAARLTVATASGDAVAFRERLLFDAGLGLRLCAMAHLWVLEGGLCLEATHFLSWTRLIVDGQPALETGHTLLGLGLQFAYRASE